MKYGLRSASHPAYVVWLTPLIGLWGATRLLPDFLRHLKEQLRTNEPNDALGQPLTTVGLVTGRPEFYLERAFDDVASSEMPRFPRTLEIMLVPGVMAAVSVHAPIGAQTGLPVPLGFASFDIRVIERTEAFLAGRAEPFFCGKPYEVGLMQCLLKAPS